MGLNEMLPWLNLLLPPLFVYIVRIENRLTRLEAARDAERELRGVLPCVGGGALSRG